MNDFDDLKRKWKSIDIPNGNGNASDKAHIRGNTHLTIRERIVKRLKRMISVSMCGILTTPIFSRELNAPAWFITLFILYFVAAAAMNGYLIHTLKRFNFATATTIEAIDFVTGFARLRNRMRTTLICCAVPLLALMLWVIDHGNEPMLLLSAAIGGVIGGILGLLINRRFKQELHLMQRTLQGDI